LRPSSFSPLTGIPWFPTAIILAGPVLTDKGFQSPDGDSVVSHIPDLGCWWGRDWRRFSPLTGIPWFPTRERLRGAYGAGDWFQSPDGDSVVSHWVRARIPFRAPDILVSVP